MSKQRNIIYNGARIAGGLAAVASQYRSHTNTSSASTVNMAGPEQIGGATVSRRYRRTGRKKKRSTDRVFRSLLRTGEEIVLRYQNTSQTYFGPGKVLLAYGDAASTGLAGNRRFPIHFMSLTLNPKGEDVPEQGCYPFFSLCRAIGYQGSTNNWSWASDVPSQISSGADGSSVAWQYEMDMTGVGAFNGFNGNVFHKWTDIKLNLYGTYSVPITYKVFLCSMPKEYDPFMFVANAPMDIYQGQQQWFKDMARDLVHDSIGHNASERKWQKHVKIVKRHTVTIQPLPYSDQVAEVSVPAGYSKAPHIHELRWFVRHDRYRDYKWSRTTHMVADSTLGDGGWDYSNNIPLMADVEWGKRLFLFVTCSDPANLAPDQLFADTTTAISHGSYDICVRNSFIMTPSH